MTFDDYSLVARAGGAPLLAVSRDAVTRGAASVERISGAASPVVHRVLVAAFSTLASTGMFELSLEGVVTRAISVDASAETMQNVSFCRATGGGGSVQVTLRTNTTYSENTTYKQRFGHRRPLILRWIYSLKGTALSDRSTCVCGTRVADQLCQLCLSWPNQGTSLVTSFLPQHTRRSQILREDFSSLGVYPSVAIVAAANLRLAGDHRAWDVSWDSIPGNAMESVDFSCAAGANVTATYTGEGTCTTELVVASAGGSPLSGKFTLTVVSSSAPASSIYYDTDVVNDNTAWAGEAETTSYLDYNVTAAELRAALEALPGVAVADVELVNSITSGNRDGGSFYLVTFPGASGAKSPMGGLSLAASATGLNGTGAGATVREVQPGSRWGGEFALSIGGLESSALSFEAQAEEVQEAVATLVDSAGGGEGGGSVEVWREELDDGFRWAVAFSGGNLDGDISLMKVGECALGDGTLCLCFVRHSGATCLFTWNSLCQLQV